jgi:hypothetical protein
VYGLTDGEIAHGPADVSGTTFLATEPTLDISAPFAECFVEGTRILTQRGERAVESLLPGDGIVTASGEILPVRWVGMQTLSGQFAARHRLLPVRVRAGALGAGQPWRDLLLSPGHALLLDDLLVQAGALANSDSIVAGADVPATFRYFHVELPRHAVLFAEGAAAESYRAGLELLPFDNAADRPPADEGDELPNPRVRAARQVPPTICARLARWAVPPGPVAARSSRRIGQAEDGSNWLNRTTAISSCGSIQKAVLAAPPQATSPGVPRICAAAGFSMTENPRPKPMPT